MNTPPGMTEMSLLPKVACEGISFIEMVRIILEEASLKIKETGK